MKIHELGKDKGRAKKRTRVGRGESSGLGKTSGYGHKGSQARSGRGKGYGGGFEGGQMPLQRRLPKRGFKSMFREEFAIVNVGQLERFDAGSVIDTDALKSAGAVRGRNVKVKILGKGELTRKLTVRAAAVSAGARQKIEAAGGTVEVAAPAPAAE